MNRASKPLPRRPLGATGLTVSALGLGGGGLGDDVTDRDVDRLLGAALDAGVDLVDVAPSYGEAEVRLGRGLKGRRDRFVVSTKVGYGIPGVPDWTGPAVTRGVDRALERLATDCIDIVHLHSCPSEILERGDVVEALLRAKEAGKIRVAAYSGDGHALYVAYQTGAFGVVQASLSVCDRHDAPTLALCREAGLGTLAKRPLANAPWRFEARPERPDQAEYWERWRALSLSIADLSPEEAALRFCAHHPQVDAALMGTRSPEHLLVAAAAVRRGPLPKVLETHFATRWAAMGKDWSPLV